MKKVFCVFVFMTVLCAIAFIVLSCKKKEAPEDDYVFKINLSVGYLCQAPLYIAAEKGYFDDEGLKWDRVNTSDTDTMALFSTGKVDGAIGLMVGLIQPIANGLPVQIPLAVHTGCIKVLVRGDSEINNVEDLKGKKFGGGGPAVSAVLFAKRVMAGHGLKVDGENAEIDYIYQSGAELPLLLQRGIVDAIALTDPAAQIAIDENGFRAIVDNAVDAEFKDEYCCVSDVSAETVKKYPKATAKFLRAIQRGAKFVQENPDEAAEILVSSEYVTINPALISKMLKTYNWNASVSKALPALERNMRDLQKLGILKSDVDVERLIKEVYVVVPGVPDSAF